MLRRPVVFSCLDQGWRIRDGSAYLGGPVIFLLLVGHGYDAYLAYSSERGFMKDMRLGGIIQLLDHRGQHLSSFGS